ncbi:hypothetical protein [Halomonas sp. 25-S5]|uniref:hypothetical protein n=1 Tax=Halomonas sp. 25-S5 TaxID=2994065 RepID=UPI0024699F01|nr:hypothetical protein [Halomonas sp. 25-S5]
MPTNHDHEIREAMELTRDELAAAMDGGQLTEDAIRRAHAAFEFAISTVREPAPMTQHEAMEASVAAFSREERDQAVSRAHHCVDSVLEELRQVAMGDALTPERAFLLVVALESAGDNLEDILEGLFD